MKKTLTFDDLLIPDNYLKLQNKFKYDDDRSPREENFFTKIQIDDFDIVYGGLNPDTGENEVLLETFFTHYLEPNIKLLYKNFFAKYLKLYNKLEMENGNLALYYRQHLNKILSYYKVLEKCGYLNDGIKEMITQELDLCLDNIQNLHKKSEHLLDNKIDFKLMRQDLLVLFLLLREKEVIKWYSYRELKVLIENNFRCLDTESKSYQDVSVKRTHLSDYKNGGRSIQKSLNRLKEIFQRKDFFQIT